MDSSNERKCYETKEPLIQKTGGTEKEKEKGKTRRRKLQPRNKSPRLSNRLYRGPTDRVDKVIAVLQIPHGTSHVVIQLNLCPEQLYLPSTLSCDPTDGVIPVGLLNSGGSGGWRKVGYKCRPTISNSKEN